MEAFGIYLLKSVVWLTGFAIVFLTVLRNERFFRINRIYLLAGIIASIAFPFYTWHYVVISPSEPTGNISISGISAYVLDDSPPAIPLYWWLYAAGIGWLAFRLIWQTVRVLRKLRHTGYEVKGAVKLVRTSEYAASFSFFSFVFVNPSTSDVETNEIVNHESEHIQQRHWFDLLLVEILCLLQWFNPFVWIYARLIRQNHEYLADERALRCTSDPAIYQATLLNQLLGAPVISLANSFSYSLNKKRFKMMKKSIDSPYRKLKLLLVIPLMALVFYAFAKPEYITTESVFQKDKVSLINEGTDTESGIVKGKVVNADGKPLQGTSVIIRGTTTGTITDKGGNFKLKDVPKEGELVFSFVGMQSVVLKPDLDKPLNVKMISETIAIDKVIVVGYANPSAPSPPPPPGTLEMAFKSIDSKNPPLIFLDGVLINKSKMDEINPDHIESISVLKDKSATALYGDKAKDGAILIVSKKTGTTGVTLKKNVSELESTNSTANPSKIESFDPKHPPLYIVDGIITDTRRAQYFLEVGVESVTSLRGKVATDKYGEKGSNGVVEMILKKNGTTDQKSENVEFAGNPLSEDVDQPFVIVEKMPQFPGGDKALMNFIVDNLKYPPNAKKEHISGTVVVNFVVNRSGELTRQKVVRGIGGGCDEEALRIFTMMPKWNPGFQGGKAVRVSYTVPVKFKLDGDTQKKVAGFRKWDGKPYVVVEEMPQFPGGEKALMKFIREHIRYPVEAGKVNAQGNVIVNFIVSSSGKVENAKVVQSVHPGLDAEALRIIGLMPDWKPGTQDGKAVDVAYAIPIQFVLQ